MFISFICIIIIDWANIRRWQKLRLIIHHQVIYQVYQDYCRILWKFYFFHVACEFSNADNCFVYVYYWLKYFMVHFMENLIYININIFCCFHSNVFEIKFYIKITVSTFKMYFLCFINYWVVVEHCIISTLKTSC